MCAVSWSLSCIAQCLLAVPVDGPPVRFGVALPARALARGLRLEGRGALQWRRLPVGGDAADPAWIELAIVAPRGTARVLAGGAGPSPDGNGPAFVFERSERPVAEGAQSLARWRWRDGVVDEQVRTRMLVATTGGDERFEVGEAWTQTTPGLDRRAHAWLRLAPAVAVACGLLPPQGSGGAVAADVRRRLRDAVPVLPELPGARGAGDYARSGGVVCNGEFDTPLALLRVGLGLADERAFAAARRAARHLVDRDLDARTGLPFAHGPDHRRSEPEPGHAWLQGLLQVGLVTADDGLIDAANSLAAAVAGQRPLGEGRLDRLRDHAWPLRELESLLAVSPSPALAAAADRIARGIATRWDASRRTFRFGESATPDGAVLERGWLAAGLLLPALRLHLARRPDPALGRRVDDYAAALRQRLLAGGDGLPTHWRLGPGGDAFAEHREHGTGAACLLLDALSPRDLERALARSTARRAMQDVVATDHPDLATEFTLVARCDWVWR